MDRYYLLRCLVSLVIICYANAECTSVKLPDGMKTVTTKWEHCKALGEAKFFWKYDVTTFTSAMVTPKGDWVGVGFKQTDTEGMWGADISVGFINSKSEKVFEDLISKKPAGATGKGGKPTKDGTQNGKLLTISHVGSNSLFEFSRPLAAADDEDVTIDPKKKMLVLWATGPVKTDDISYHGHTNHGKYFIELNGAQQRIYSLTTVCLTIVFSWIVLAL